MRQGRSFRQRMPTGTRTLIQRAIAVLRRFGTDAHVYLPGVGMLNGLQAGNFINSAGTQPGVVDSPVGLVLDATGGIHATQPTTSAKPILRKGAVNRLPYSNDVTAAGWAGVNTTRASGSLTRTSTVSPCYTSMPDLQTAFAIGEKFTAYALVKAKTAGNFFGLRPTGVYPNRVDALFNLTTGTVVGATIAGGFTGAAASIAGPDINGFYLCAVSGTVGTSELVRVLAGPADSTATIGGWEGAATTLSDCFVSALGISSGTYTAAQIQALGGIPLTTTAPASTALGPYSWGFDGLNDSLSLGGPLFQMADDHWVVAVASAESLATTKHIFNNCNGSIETQRLCNLAIGTAGSPIALWRDDAGTLASIQHSGTYAPGTRWVIAGVKRGNDKQLRVNGVQSGATNTTVLGATTTTSAIIGAFLAGGTGAFHGQVSGIMGGKGTITDADLLLIEKALGQMAGVAI